MSWKKKEEEEGASLKKHIILKVDKLKITH